MDSWRADRIRFLLIVVEMGERAVVVVDANVLINLAAPVVDLRDIAPSGEDPLKAVLSSYDVHVPSEVLGEVTEIAAGDDLLGTAAELILSAVDWLSVNDVEAPFVAPLDDVLDSGKTRGIALANAIDADMFVTDEFNSFKYQFISLAIDDRNILFTTPHLLCVLGAHGVLDTGYVHHALSYYVETKHWDRSYVDALRTMYLPTN